MNRARGKRSKDAWGFDQVASDAAFEAVGDRVTVETGRLVRLWRRLQARAYTVEDRELSLAQVDALATLMEGDSWRMSEIAARLGIDPSTASRTLAPLVEMGLVRRVPDPSDRRIVRVEVAPAGRRVHTGFADTRRAMMREIVGRMAPSRRELFAELLEEFRAANEQAETDRLAKAAARD